MGTNDPPFKRAITCVLIVLAGCAHSAPAAPVASSSDAEPADDYPTHLHNVVLAQWKPPALSLEAGAGLVAEVLLSVHEDGTLEVLRVRQPSGVPEFDASCVAAVEAASPAKPPPERYRKLLAKGLVIQFDGRALPP